ncbi:transcriptional activator FlhC [Caballeronia concitans]|uniref:Transcriptional activator FlhC n=2 Tax=Caballeronia concitans TaxID=1777133 RepID=A0A658R500_9BURK|nr:flagellar transcriptional activator FlhC [Burkholderia sp. MR1]SAL50558.1 transcriptional activator FlhC [Caballeronia concitans]
MGDWSMRALHAEQFEINGEPLQMDLTRAWTLIRFKNAGTLRLAGCARWRGRFVAHNGISLRRRS